MSCTVNLWLNHKDLKEGYSYDALGNVWTRTQYWGGTGFDETFTYDALNRLATSTITGQPQQVFTYDDIGNLTSKTGVGTYRYRSGRPHAVTDIDAGSLAYDANGNLLTAPGRSTPLTWTSLDMPLRATKGSGYSDFVYGADRQRVRQARSNGTVIYYADAMNGSARRHAVGNISYRLQRPSSGDLLALSWSTAPGWRVSVWAAPFQPGVMSLRQVCARLRIHGSSLAVHLPSAHVGCTLPRSLRRRLMRPVVSQRVSRELVAHHRTMTTTALMTNPESVARRARLSGAGKKRSAIIGTGRMIRTSKNGGTAMGKLNSMAAVTSKTLRMQRMPCSIGRTLASQLLSNSERFYKWSKNVESK